MERRMGQRRSQFKKSFEDPRRKREHLQHQIRKVNRATNLNNKRVLEGFVGEGQDKLSIWEQAHHENPEANVVVEQIDAAEQERKNRALLEDCARELTSGDPEKEELAVNYFRKLLSIEKNPPIEDVINLNVVPWFIRFLMDNSRPKLQFEAAWALTNIASGTTSQTKVVVEGGAVPILVQLLSSDRVDVCEQAVWALGNISGDCIEYRNLVHQSGALEHLLRLLNKPDQKISMMRNGTWTLSNLCRGKPAPQTELLEQLIPTLVLLIQGEDQEILTDACWSLSYLSDGPDVRIQLLLDAGVCPRIVELLSSPELAIITPALRTVGNIATGTNAQTDVIILCGGVPKIGKLLSCQRKSIRREACWTISNITAGSVQQIQAVMEAKLIPTLVEMMITGDFEIKKEAAWVICNAATGGQLEQIEYMITCGCVAALCSILQLSDNKMLEIALDAIRNILRFGEVKQASLGLENNPFDAILCEAGGVPLIYGLLQSSHPVINNKAWSLVLEYLPQDEAHGFSEDHGEVGFDNFGAKAPEGGFNFTQAQDTQH